MLNNFGYNILRKLNTERLQILCNEALALVADNQLSYNFWYTTQQR